MDRRRREPHSDCFRCSYLEDYDSWKSSRSELADLKVEVKELESTLYSLNLLEDEIKDFNRQLKDWCELLRKFRIGERNKRERIQLLKEEVDERQSQFDEVKHAKEGMEAARRQFNLTEALVRINQFAEEYMGKEAKQVIKLMNDVISNSMESKDKREFEAALALVFYHFEVEIKNMIKASKPPISFDRTKKAIDSIRGSIDKLAKTHDSTIPMEFIGICDTLVRKAEESSRDSNYELAEAYDDAARILLDDIDQLYKDPDLSRALKLGK